MPISKQNRARYPRDWSEISARVREEAGQKCEWCSVPNGVLVRRGTTADYREVWRYGSAYAYENGRYYDGSEAPDSSEDTCDYGPAVRVVLTVAHLDHQPENCERGNLKALCQRCHLRYDAAHHALNAARTRRARKAAGDLFDGGEE